MKKLICLFALLVSCGPLWAQCPGGVCPTPVQVQSSNGRVPDYAIKSTVKISQDFGGHMNGGTGTIVDYDAETKTCCVLTCRHVVTSPTAPVTVTTFDNRRIPARYLGASPSGADIVALEISSVDAAGKNVIHTYTPVSKTAIKPNEVIAQCGWGGGNFNQRLGRFLGRNTFSASGGRNEPWRCHWNDTASFASISGDSGSGIFSVERPELVGVLWGGDGQTTKYCGSEYCYEVWEKCFKCRRPRGGGGGGGGGIPVIPGNPGAPATPAVPSVPGTPTTAPAAPAAPDLKPLAAKLDDLGQGLTKLTEINCKLAEGMGSMNTRLITVEERLAAAEKARCSCSGAGSTPATPPSASKDDLTKVQDELARLKQTLKQSGTLRINIDPRK